MAEKEKKKPSKKVKIIGNVIFFSVITAMVTFFIWNFIDIRSGYKYPIFGTRTSVIVSPSMATVNEANTYVTPEMKQIKPYDTVTTKNYKSYDDIQIYDIATYFAGNDKLICHRVIDKYEDGGKQYIVFRGDANATNDAPVSYDLIRGKVVNISRGTGHFIAFIQSPFFFLAIFGTIFFVSLGMFIIDRSKKNKELEQKATEADDDVVDEQTPAEEEKFEEKQADAEPAEEAQKEEVSAEEKPAEEAPKEEAENADKKE